MAVVFGIPAIAAAFQFSFGEDIKPYSWFFFWPAIYFSALFGSFRESMLSTLVSILTVLWFFVPEKYTLVKQNSLAYISAALFFSMSVLFSIFQNNFKKSKNTIANLLADTEQTYQKLLRSLADGVFVAQDYRFVFCSYALPNLLGYTQDEFLGLGFSAVIAPEYLEIWNQRFEQRVGTGPEPVRQYELRFLRKNGERVWVELRANRAIYQGRPAVLGIIRDITDRRRSEAQLRLNELRFRVALSDSPIFTFEQDVDLRYVWIFNPKFGYSVDGIIGKTDADIMNPACLDPLTATKRQVIATGKSVRKELVMGAPGQALQFFDTYIEPRYADDGSINGVICAASEITELKRVESELRTSQHWMKSVLDNSPGLLGYWGKDLRYVFANRTYQEWLGVDFADIQGKHVREILGDDLVDQNLPYIEGALKGVRQEFERDFPRHNEPGVRRTLVQYIPDFRDNDVVGFFVQVSDITAFKDAQDALRENEKRNELERIQLIERQRDALVREVHHRIKNHLQGVIGLIRERGRTVPALAPVLEEAVNQIRLIADVYGLQSNRDGVQWTLERLVGMSVQLNLGARRIIFDASLPDNFRSARLDQDDVVPLALAINELVTNAVKHSDATESDRPVNITVREGSDASCRLVIRNGPATLPPGFSLSDARNYGSGLELALTLLPRKIASLDVRQEGDGVVAELVISSPASAAP